MIDVERTTSLTGPRTEQVRALAEEVRRADGVEALGEQTLLALAAEDATVVHLLATGTAEDGEGTGELVGYAQVDLAGSTTAPASAEIAVAPAHRRHGVGRALLAGVREVAAQHGRPGAVVWAHGDLPAARGLAGREGLGVVRELLQLERPLSPEDAAGAPPPAPDGVVVRPFVVGQDEDAWVHLNARAFAGHPEQGRLTRADVEAREAEPWFSAGDLLLAERAGRLVASVWMKVEPGSDAGELYVLGVDPYEQGTGLGRHLTALVVRHLARAGLRRAVLYVDGDNVPAVRTYERAGFRRARVDVQYG